MAIQSLSPEQEQILSFINTFGGISKPQILEIYPFMNEHTVETIASILERKELVSCLNKCFMVSRGKSLDSNGIDLLWVTKALTEDIRTADIYELNSPLVACVRENGKSFELATISSGESSKLIAISNAIEKQALQGLLVDSLVLVSTDVDTKKVIKDLDFPCDIYLAILDYEDICLKPKVSLFKHSKKNHI